MSRARVRLYALISSTLTLVASLIFSIAITRKLPIMDLGYLNVFTGAISFGLLPTGISNFITPRLAARYRHVQITVLISSMLLGFVGMAIAGTFLFLIHSEIPKFYFYSMLILALLSVLSYSFNAPFVGSLTVLNRPRMVFTSIITSIVKLVAIFYIFYSHWSLISVLISTFIITLSGVIYSGMSLVPYMQSFGKLKTTLREFLSGSWIAMLGYASSNLRSVDTFMIAAIGGILDNAGWQVLNIIGSVYAFRGMLMNLTYGELLQLGSHAKQAYIDFLLLMFTTTDLALYIVAFEPNVIEFLRPSNPNLIVELFIPMVLWAATNIVNSLSQYISAAMQGTDRVDMEKELTLGTYWKSTIFYANIAEFIMTVSYIALIVPMIFLIRAIELQFYVLDGVILSSAISLVIAITIRARKFPTINEFLPLKSIVRDYIVPLAITTFALFLLRAPLISAFPPSISITTGIINLIALLAAVSAVYLAVSVAISKNVRHIVRVLLKRL
ncbi:MAG: hypothetical protein QXG99_03315 [Conexivisphaerales archaeon]